MNGISIFTQGTPENSFTAFCHEKTQKESVNGESENRLRQTPTLPVNLGFSACPTVRNKFRLLTSLAAGGILWQQLQ